MASALDKLNLRPQERRLLVVAALVIFTVLNVWLVWPRLKQINRLRTDRLTTETTLSKFRGEVQKLPQYQTRLKKLKSAGLDIPPDDQGLHLQRTVLDQAQESGLMIVRQDFKGAATATAKATNDFFEERSGQLQVQAGDKELVDFLYALGSGDSLIRVKTLTISPDRDQSRLIGNVTLVASYQKKAPTTPARIRPKSRTAKTP